MGRKRCYLCFFLNDTATTEIYTLSLHDALPILIARLVRQDHAAAERDRPHFGDARRALRSEEHTSELQSLRPLVCRLLLENKKTTLTMVRLANKINSANTSPRRTKTK